MTPCGKKGDRNRTCVQLDLGKLKEVYFNTGKEITYVVTSQRGYFWEFHCYTSEVYGDFSRNI